MREIPKSGWKGGTPLGAEVVCGFDRGAGKTSLAWRLRVDGREALHAGVFDTPATALGVVGRDLGDAEVAFTLASLPAGGVAQFGLCNAQHLLENQLGWRNSLCVGTDGVVRWRRYAAGPQIGRILEGDRVTVRLRGRCAWFRRDPCGCWNGSPDADPDQGRGGLPVEFPGPLYPAIYAERPGTRIGAAFEGWELGAGASWRGGGIDGSRGACGRARPWT